MIWVIWLRSFSGATGGKDDANLDKPQRQQLMEQQQGAGEEADLQQQQHQAQQQQQQQQQAQQQGGEGILGSIPALDTGVGEKRSLEEGAEGPDAAAVGGDVGGGEHEHAAKRVRVEGAAPFDATGAGGAAVPGSLTGADLLGLPPLGAQLPLSAAVPLATAGLAPLHAGAPLQPALQAPEALYPGMNVPLLLPQDWALYPGMHVPLLPPQDWALYPGMNAPLLLPQDWALYPGMHVPLLLPEDWALYPGMHVPVLLPEDWALYPGGHARLLPPQLQQLPSNPHGVVQHAAGLAWQQLPNQPFLHLLYVGKTPNHPGPLHFLVTFQDDLQRLNMSSGQLWKITDTGLWRGLCIKQFLLQQGYPAADREYKEWRKLFRMLAVDGNPEPGEPGLNTWCQQ